MNYEFTMRYKISGGGGARPPLPHHWPGVTSMPPVVPFAFTIKMKSRCQDGLARAINDQCVLKAVIKASFRRSKWPFSLYTSVYFRVLK